MQDDSFDDELDGAVSRKADGKKRRRPAYMQLPPISPGRTFHRKPPNFCKRGHRMNRTNTGKRIVQRANGRVEITFCKACTRRLRR